MPVDQNQLLGTFLDEASEHLIGLEQGLLHVGEGHADPELLNAIFRAAHSVKGGSGVFGMETLTRLTHSLEQLLDRLRNGQLDPAPELIDLLLRGVDGMGQLLTAARNGETPDPNETSDVLLQLESTAGIASGTPVVQTLQEPSASGLYRIQIRPGPGLLANGADPFLLLRNLAKRAEIVSITASTEELPDLWSIDPERCYFSWSLLARTEAGPEALEQPFAFVLDDCSVQIAADQSTTHNLTTDISEQLSPISTSAVIQYLTAYEDVLKWYSRWHPMGMTPP